MRYFLTFIMLLGSILLIAQPYGPQGPQSGVRGIRLYVVKENGPSEHLGINGDQAIFPLEKEWQYKAWKKVDGAWVDAKVEYYFLVTWEVWRVTNKTCWIDGMPTCCFPLELQSSKGRNFDSESKAKHHMRLLRGALGFEQNRNITLTKKMRVI